MKVGRFIYGVLARALPVLLITSVITFLLTVFADQDPADLLLGEAATAAAVAELNHELGRDRPILVQFLDWSGSALQGDLGVSWFTGIPVATTIVDRLPVSLSIAALALLIAVLLGGVAGITAALKRGSWVDRLVTLTASTLAALPPFVVSIGFILLFGVVIPILPTGGYVPFSQSLVGWLASIILPAAALALEAAADIARQLRTALVQTYEENFVTGARLRGLSKPRILFRHALPQAAGPALATLGIQVPRLIGGAIIAEQIFALPGLGLMAYDGAMQGDQPVVLGSVMVTVVVVLISTLVIDLILLSITPAARRDSRSANQKRRLKDPAEQPNSHADAEVGRIEEGLAGLDTTNGRRPI